MSLPLRIAASLFVLSLATAARAQSGSESDWIQLGLGLVFPKRSQTTQTASPVPAGSEVVERVSPSVVLILIRGSGGAEGYASGLIVSENGVLLTAYHSVKGASAVQVRLKNGEVFDNVQLVAQDERRDVAALRIPGAGLAVAPAVGTSEIRAGEEVYVISNPAGLAWTTTSGILSGVRMADEVAGAGQGYRLLQFTAPISPGSGGGVLVDKQGRALGIVNGSLSGGQNSNFAVPLESVVGLAQMSGGASLASGSGLQLPQSTPSTPSLPAVEPASPPERQGGFFNPGEEPRVLPVNPGASEPSVPINSRDPLEILRSFRTVFIVSKSVWLRQELMQTALQKQTSLGRWGIAIVSDPQVADVRLTVNRVLFTWTWTYELVHQNTGIILDSGKMNAAAGGAASDKIAEAVVKRISAARGMPAEVAPQSPQKR